MLRSLIKYKCERHYINSNNSEVGLETATFKDNVTVHETRSIYNPKIQVA